MHAPARQSGFTLIELLFYIAITLITAVVIISGIVSFGRVLAQFKLTEDLNYSANVALDTLVRDVRNASEINTAASAFDDPAGVLVLTFVASDDTTFERRYYVTGSILYVVEGVGTPTALTRSRVAVNGFSVAHRSSAVSDAVRISLDLSASRGSITKTQSLTTAAVVRSLYR
jgi:type II secretory pathway pseudopilin PulG